MNCIVDIGNTKTKIYFFNENELEESQAFFNHQEKEIISCLINTDFYQGILSCSGPKPSYIDWSNFISLDAETKLPIQLDYKTPKTLGSDRIALACGANFLFPQQNTLIISAGTCITIDFINKQGYYEGGIITPGITIRLQSLHKFTANLPLLPHSKNVEFPLIGKSTQESMESGIYNGAIAEVKQTISDFESIYKDLTVIITGGDANLFELHLKKKIFAQQNIQAIGLNRILIYNAV